MKQLLLSILTIGLIVACAPTEQATPTVSPELVRLERIENDVRTACDAYLEQSARGDGNEIVLRESIGLAYVDALNVFEGVDYQSPHRDAARRTLSRVATVQRHMETYEDEVAAWIVRVVEGEAEPPDKWHTGSVELCASW